MTSEEIVKRNPWEFLKKFTESRIAIGRTGVSVPTSEYLDFKLSHSKAKDAVNIPLNFENLKNSIGHDLDERAIILESRALDRATFLKRPDLGRLLSEDSEKTVRAIRNEQEFDISIAVADGLSAKAIELNAVPFLKILLPMLEDGGYGVAPIFLVREGRVAVGDDIAEFSGSRMSVILIGERPGLKTPDSMGIYMTYSAVRGTTDERRNCISNIRPGGMSCKSGAMKLKYLIDKSFKLSLSGVDLKDDEGSETLGNEVKSGIE